MCERPDELWQRRSSSFGASASDYADHRPDYAPAAIAWALAGADHQVVDVVDLGAGTGQLTRGLSQMGLRVTAVEPDERMLAELRRRVPEAATRLGSAEEIPMPDGAVDAVLAATSFHWFDQERAFAEIARVLRPGGVLGLLYNLDDETVPWVRELGRIKRTSASTPPTEEKWPVDERFGPFEENRFPHQHPRTAASLTATIGTHSHTLVVSSEERAETLARVREFLDACPETSGGTFAFPLVTLVGRAHRLAPASD